MADVNASVEMADGYPGAVPGRMRGHELRRAGVARRHVCVLSWRGAVGRKLLGTRCLPDIRRRRAERLISLDALHAVDLRGSVDLVGRHVGADISHISVLLAHD